MFPDDEREEEIRLTERENLELTEEDNGHTEKANMKRCYAIASFPEEVTLCKSSIPGTNYGVCAKQHIPMGTWIGPYEGRRVTVDDVKTDMNMSHMWEVRCRFRNLNSNIDEKRACFHVASFATSRHATFSLQISVLFQLSLFYAPYSVGNCHTTILFLFQIYLQMCSQLRCCKLKKQTNKKTKRNK